MAKTKDMDYYLTLLTKTNDTKEKLTLGQDILAYLQSGASIECQDIGMVVDGILPFIQSSNFKVSQMGLDVMTELVRRMEHFYRPYIPSVLPSVIDRLGDSKELVRERCQLLLATLMEVGVLSPQQLFDRLVPAFSHRNSNVRDEAMKCLVATLNQHGANCIAVSRIVPLVVKLLSDPNALVRDEALVTLTQVYRHVGDRLRADLIKKQSLPPSKVSTVMAKFDEIKSANDFFPTAVNNVANLADEDETDRSLGSSSSRRSPSVTLRRNVSSVSSKPPPLSSVDSTSSLQCSASKFSRAGSLRKPKPASTPISSSAAAGAVDEESFIKAFENVPTVQIFSSRDLEDSLTKIRQTIEDTNQDWNKRVDAIKRIRSLVVAGAHNYDEFYSHLRSLDPPFQATVKDLRSQVVREACVTIAFLAQTLGLKFEHFADNLLPVLTNQIQNSAKIIASASQVALGFIVRYTPAGRLIAHLYTAMSHKSREIRRAIIKAIHQVISSWPMHPLQRHLTTLQNALASAIADADQEVRMTARKAYWAFKEHFPEQAEVLLNTLDAPYKRSLHSDMSNSSSSNSLHQPVSRTRPPIDTPSARRALLPSGSTTPASRRSNSAVDLQAAQRAKARAQYAALARQKVGSNASLPRPKRSDGPSSLSGTPSPSPFSPEHSRQGRSRSTRVSVSQPSSRSGSPSSRLNYATFSASGTDRSRRSPSYSGSRSGATSRETSPGRYGMPPPSSGGRRGNSAIRSTLPSRPPLLSQRILNQSLEAESALADALGDASVVTSPRRPRLEDHSDDSETSSVCSERSFESNAHRRTSDSFSWSGSQSRLYRELWEPCMRDINDIMLACESTHWSDRKDGLVSLSAYLQAGNTLSPHQLARITENFTKMLSDSHTKVFTLFLDTVSDLITSHCSDLHQWLYILLTRLFHKLGSDLLTSVQAKIMRTLDTVRDVFGPEAVMGWALRFLVDPTQTPNARVKLAVLQWLAKTAPLADPSSAFPPVTGDKDITALALTKMIGWTMGDSIKQGSELRRAAQEAILALFNLNPPYVTLRFSQLPKEYQEAAASIIQGRVRKASGGPESPGRHESALSPDQVYRSLRRTTAEIQSYSFDNKVADTASHDSGISQMSLNDNKPDIDVLTNWSMLSLSSPTRSTNGLDTADSASNGINGTGEAPGDDNALGKMLDTIESLAGEEKKLALSLLATKLKESDPVIISHHFKRVLRIILAHNHMDSESREASLVALSELLKKRSLGPQLQSFTELILIQVIKAYSDPNRDLAKCTETCIEEIAVALQPDAVLKVLMPLMSTGPYPHNLSVIKAITKVIEAHNATVLHQFLPVLIPGLIQAYGHEESLVRKSAVFCMVALHEKVGDSELRPYLVGLSASKLKLLELYINKKQSPKSESS